MIRLPTPDFSKITRFQPRSQGLSSLPSLVVGRKTLVAAGHVTTCDTNLSTGVESTNNFCRSQLKRKCTFEIRLWISLWTKSSIFWRLQISCSILHRQIQLRISIERVVFSNRSRFWNRQSLSQQQTKHCATPLIQQIFLPSRFWVVTWPATTRVCLWTTTGGREERPWEWGLLDLDYFNKGDPVCKPYSNLVATQFSPLLCVWAIDVLMAWARYNHVAHDNFTPL